MLATILAAVVELGATYVDTQARFNLDLPPCWEQRRMPGADSGSSFRCAIEDRIGLVAIQVVSTTRVNAAAVARQLGRAIDGEPGYRLVEEGSTELAGLPAARRRYVTFVDDRPTMVKMAEDRVVVAEGQAFVVHVESLQATFAYFEPDFERMFASFRLGGEPARAQPRLWGPLAGTWTMVGDDNLVLELGDDGTFRLAGTTGSYRIEGKALLMWQNGVMERFGWKLERDELVLSSPNLGEPVRYRRAPPDLSGTWRGHGRVLVLERDGHLSLDGVAGTYRIQGQHLIIRIGGKKRVIRFEIKGSVLAVSGWSFAKKTMLERH